MKNGWIDTKDKLPDIDKEVWILLESLPYHKRKGGMKWKTKGAFKNKDTCIHFWGDGDYSAIDQSKEKILAWQEIVEPIPEC